VRLLIFLMGRLLAIHMLRPSVFELNGPLSPPVRITIIEAFQAPVPSP